MNEWERLLGRIDDWTEELLLRGSTQFAMEDARKLEQLADLASRLGMDLLERLLRRTANAGERSLLGPGDGAEELAGAFFRLCGYTELARQGGGGTGGSVDDEPEAEPAEGEDA